MSRAEVSFDAFARLFRDGLNCPNALFLDGGSAASLYAPSFNRHCNIVPLRCIREKIEALSNNSQRQQCHSFEAKLTFD